MYQVVIIGVLYHYLVSALGWAIETIEATLSAVDIATLSGEKQETYTLLQQAVCRYRLLVEEYKPKAYWQEEACLETAVFSAFREVLEIVCYDVCCSIRRLKTLQN